MDDLHRPTQYINITTCILIGDTDTSDRHLFHSLIQQKGGGGTNKVTVCSMIS